MLVEGTGFKHYLTSSLWSVGTKQMARAYLGGTKKPMKGLHHTAEM